MMFFLLVLYLLHFTLDFLHQVFHEMMSTGVEPNEHTYGALIDGCARASQVAKAFGVYGILRSKVCSSRSSRNIFG